jgi:lysozyme
MSNLTEDLIRHEGYRQDLYEDTEGIITIGVGYNIQEKGLPDYIIKLLLNDSINEARSELDRIKPDWTRYSDNRQEVLINMMFNLGAPRFQEFRKFWKALKSNNFNLASAEMLDSKWSRQVGSRATELALRMEQG